VFTLTDIPTVRQRMIASDDPILIWVSSRLNDQRLLDLCRLWAETGTDALAEMRSKSKY
jgi:hypothetical protein